MNRRLPIFVTASSRCFFENEGTDFLCVMSINFQYTFKIYLNVVDILTIDMGPLESKENPDVFMYIVILRVCYDQLEKL